MIEQMSLKGARSLKIPGVKEEKKTDRELRADIDQSIDENERSEENNLSTDGGFPGGVDNRRESTCGRCHAKFNSCNDLFKHMNRKGHIVASDGEDNDNEHINRVASSRGRKKISRSERKDKQLYITGSRVSRRLTTSTSA